MASQAIDKHWDKWVATNESTLVPSNDGAVHLIITSDHTAHGIIVLENDSSSKKVSFLFGDEEFLVSYPSDYPTSSSPLVPSFYT